jgi:Tetratricopeptide repeat
VQRRFYERAGLDLWRAGLVPHHATSNVALASAYARVVLGFLRDTRARGPIDVIELGGGSGRFAFLFLRALDALDRAAPIRYVMTDVATSTIDAWRSHEALRPYVRAGRLDFARFDADLDDRLHVERAKRVISAQRPVRHAVVIANYVLSGLRQDAFGVRAGRIREHFVALEWPRRGRRVPGEVSLTSRLGPHACAPYGEGGLDTIVRDYADVGVDGRFLFPIGPLRCLARMRALVRGCLFVLAADRGTAAPADALTRAPDLGMGRHGALSFPVSFHALRAWTMASGGVALRPRPGYRHLHLAGFLFGEGNGWSGTRTAYDHALRSGTPDALYGKRRALATATTVRLSRLRTLMEDCGPDPRVIAECVRGLWPHLSTADDALRRDLRDRVLAAWPNHFDAGDSDDVAFLLGLLLYAVGAYADARRLFEASLRSFRDDAATHWNLGLCHLALGRPYAARAAFQRARRLAPSLQPAGLVTTKTRRATIA